MPKAPVRYAGAHRRFDARAHYRGLVGLLVCCALAVFGLSVVHPRIAARAAGVGTVAGVVFEDYDANGLKDVGSNLATAASATDRGIAGATVTVTDSSGNSVGTGTSTASGAFSISVTSAATTAVRVEVTPPTGYTAGPHGTGTNGADTTVQFVSLGTTAASNVLVGLVRTGDYSQDAPPILTVEQAGAIGSGNNAVLDPSTEATLSATGYNQRGAAASTVITPKAYASQTGSIWGVAQLDGRYAFTSAFLRRHAAVGPKGLGAIYLTDLGSSTPNASLAATIAGAGADPRSNPGSYTVSDWFHDTAAYPAVGTLGFGGIAITPDHKYLYAVSLGDKKLYQMTITQGVGAPTLGPPTAVASLNAVPGASGTCDPTYVRPFGVTAANGGLYLTMTCTGPGAANLRGYVYRYDAGTGLAAAPAFETALSGYSRGSAYTGCNASFPCSATWNAWSTSSGWPNTQGTTSTTTNTGIANPEPELSSVAFDSNGDMTVGVKDRFADQVGYEAGNLTTSGAGSSSTYEGFAAGDVLRACPNGAGYVQESAGVCGSRTGFATSNNQGPGGGEFYDDNYGTSHAQTALGALLQVPGYGQLVGSSFDPGSAYRTEGYRFWNNTNGAKDDTHTLLDIVNANGTGQQGSFSKAGGLGNLTALVTAAPIEIGNRVWTDSNGNGLQDAGEPNQPGVTVELVPAAGGAAIASATTDANGEYYFSNAAGTSTASAIYNVSGLTSGTNYVVRIPSGQFAANAPLAGYSPTRTAVGSDSAIDSNGARADATSPDAAAVKTGADGTNDHTIDFGVVQPVTVGDYVWNDVNGDGIQESGEPGLPGVTVTISHADGTPVLESDGTPLPATGQTTDADGGYSFTGLAPGQYVVTVTTPTGYHATSDQQGSDRTKDSSTGTATSATLTSGQSDTSLDFGFVVSRVSVGDYVWNDSNGNGIQDDGPTGIAGVTVTLTGPTGPNGAQGPVTDADGRAVGPATTDTDGAYHFTDLPALAAGQHYSTHIDNSQSALAGAGLVPTKANAGTNTALDSSSRYAASRSLTTDGDSDDTLDFGFVAAVSVGDFVWNDLNGDGIQDPGEPGIGNVTVTITQADGSPAQQVDGTTVTSTTTTAGGHYLFSALRPGQYLVSVGAPGNGFVATEANQGTDTGADSSTGSQASGVLSSGQSDLSLDFGFVQPASVGDFVWEDKDHDGVQDSDEPGIDGVQVTISRSDNGPVTHADGSPYQDTTQQTRTNGATNGFYDFTDLAPGTYTVSVATPAGFIPTTPSVGNPATDSATGSQSTTLASGQDDATVDFGFVPPSVSVGDYVWQDTNRNGVQDAGDKGIAGVHLTLSGPGGAVTDVFGDPVGDAVSGFDGSYHFADLPPLPAGQHYTVHVDDTQSALSTPGYTPTTPGDGTNDARDSSTGSAESGDLTSDGDSDDTLDFGFVTPAVSVGDYVWQDVDGDGIQDDGPTGIAGVTVTLTGPTGPNGAQGPVTDVLGDPVGPATTDTNGAYSFTDLPALAPGQHYSTHIDNSQSVLTGAGLVPTKANAGSNTALDSSTRFASSRSLTTNGDRDDTLDFGFVAAVSVGDFVWDDLNGNGVQDTGETGIPNVTVTITRADGTPAQQVDGTTVTSTTTNNAGHYLFSALRPGTYSVTVASAGAGYVATRTHGSTDTGLDSSTGTVTSHELTSGQSDLSLDFGFVQPAGVGDFVWKDADRDGIQDPGETGLIGAKVTLTGANGQVTDLSGNSVTPVTIDSSGAYHFTDLPPGTYTVTVTPPSGYDASPSAAVNDPTADSSDSPVTITLTSGESDTTQDFGFYPQAVSVGDFVWFDRNGNGVQDTGETGIPNVVVTITAPGGGPVTDNSGATVGPQQTDGTGHYLFANLPSLTSDESYTVHVADQSALAGYSPTTTGQGTTDHDSSAGSAASGPLTRDGAQDLTLDFGFVKPVSVGDYVWNDSNADGVQQPAEKGIDGVELVLSRTDGLPVRSVDGTVLSGLALRTMTDPSGYYSFGDLFPGAYTVTVTAPDGYHATISPPGTPRQVDSSTGHANSTAVPSGSYDNTLDFGFVHDAVTVGDFVWLDRNGNGVQDSGDTGIPDVVLTITAPGGGDVIGVDGTTVGPQTSGAQGGYEFTGLPSLPAGEHYTVHVENTQNALAGYFPTLTGRGTHATDSSTAIASSGDLTSDTASDDSLDFGFVKPVGVGDYVWFDSNGNGQQDVGEKGIAGVTLTLANAAGGPVHAADGSVLTGSALRTTTDDDGAYSFGDLFPGAYTVTVTAPDGYTPTTARVGTDRGADSSTGSATSSTLPAGQSDETLDFGFVKPVSVGDYVWYDANHDGIQQPAEHGIAGVTLTISSVNGSPVLLVDGTRAPLTTTTDGNGAYAFTGLAPGRYSVDVTVPAGYVATLDRSGTDRAVDSSTGSATSALLAATQSDETLDFGFVRTVQVGDFVWYDANHDGVQQPDERGIRGVTVTLSDPAGRPVRDASGALVRPVTTRRDGSYHFSDLPPGQYTAHVDDTQDALAAYRPTLAGRGHDDATDSATAAATSVELDPGDADETLDFGFFRAGVTVGNFVWLDANGDGRQDDGERGIGGVVLTLRGPGGAVVHDIDGRRVGPTSTAKDGSYEFTDLPTLDAGEHYTVGVDRSASRSSLVGLQSTTAGVGPRADDSSTHAATSSTLRVDGARDMTLDFGFVTGSGLHGAGRHREPSPAAPASTGGTAFTGTPVGELLALALALLLAGGLLGFAGLRRRPRRG